MPLSRHRFRDAGGRRVMNGIRDFRRKRYTVYRCRDWQQLLCCFAIGMYLIREGSGEQLPPSGTCQGVTVNLRICICFRVKLLVGTM